MVVFFYLVAISGAVIDSMADFSTTEAFYSSLSVPVFRFGTFASSFTLALLGALSAPSMVTVSTPFCSRIGRFPSWLFVVRHSEAYSGSSSMAQSQLEHRNSGHKSKNEVDMCSICQIHTPVEPNLSVSLGTHEELHQIYQLRQFHQHLEISRVLFSVSV